MKSLLSRIIFCLLLLTVSLSSNIAYGQFEEGIPDNRLIYISKDSLLTPANTSVTMQYVSAGEISKKIKNIICFHINEESSYFLSEPFTATVTFDLETSHHPTAVSKTLTVNYDTARGSQYKARSFLVLPDEEEMVKITVTSITPNSTTGFNPRQVLQLDNEMRVLRYYELSANTTDLTPQSLTADTSGDAAHVEWEWSSDTHNNFTQLEWAWVEDEMLGFYPSNERIFATNSTRIELPAGRDSYSVPLLYSGSGKLYCRVRAGLRKNNGEVITGPWSDPQSCSFLGHEPDLNWQSSVSFAEEGKLKAVIQYYDGSLRQRQTVTKDNSTGNTIVSETMYDLQGRQNIQILPTPVDATTIKYFRDFNRFEGMTNTDPEDPARYFDLTPSAVKCQRSPALRTDHGNGLYYSPQNPWLSSEPNASFIPDAKGYAFTETRYMDDATGRVQSQGGVGEEHQIGSDHETLYFYGKPNQQELDALFGTQVGDASHYSKNMVRDANGQMSVSYVDMHGRTIATALAGANPEALDPIFTNRSDYPEAEGTLTNHLLNNSNNLIVGNQIESVSTILVPAQTIFDFTYKATPPIVELQNCSNQSICFDCKYDLEISIKSEKCGEDIPILRRYKNLSIVSAENACSTAFWFRGEGVDSILNEIHFTENLDAGSYVIRKTLTINDSIFQVRKDSALKALLCKTQQQLIDSVFNILQQTSACGDTSHSPATSSECQACQTATTDFTTYESNYLASIGNPTVYDEDMIHDQYVADSIACSITCGHLDQRLSTLATIRRLMLEDMIPYFGQYAIDSVRDTLGNVFPINPDRFESKFNIFTTDPSVSGFTKPFYLNPSREDLLLYYLDEFDNVDSTIHGHDSSGNVILQTVTRDQFRGLFKREWAASLIQYHPEYTKLAIAESNLRPSYEWLDSVMVCDSYDQAHLLHFDNPFNTATSTPQDPFMINFASIAQKQDMTKILTLGTGQGTATDGPTLWQMANSSFLCATVDGSLRNACAKSISGAGITGIDPSIPASARDTIWTKFRSLYLSSRNDYVIDYLTAQPGTLTREEMDTLLGQGKILRFGNNQDQAASAGNAEIWTLASDPTTTNLSTLEGITTSLQNSALNMCQGQRPFWKARLLQCDSLRVILDRGTHADSVLFNQIIDSILNQMVRVCEHSKDLQHPFGASNVEPTYSGSPQNFEEIVSPILAQFSIDTSGLHGYYCNTYSIDFPKPYSNNPQLAANITNVLDSCACQRFAVLQTEAQLAGYNPLNLTSLNSYLWISYSDTLSYPLWIGLQQCPNMFHDTCYTVFDSIRCPRPVIDSAIYNFGESQGYVYYTIPAGHSSCTLYIFDLAGNQLSAENLDCNATSYQISGVDPCGEYLIHIESYSDSCGLRMSDTLHYEGCCPRPHITNLTYNDKEEVLSVTYVPHPNYSQCLIHIYDQTYSLIQTVSINCGNPIKSIKDIKLDSCKNYYLDISCFSELCGWITSDTVTINNCCYKPSIDSMTFVEHDEWAVYYNLGSNCSGECLIRVYNGWENIVYTHLVTCTNDSIHLPLSVVSDCYTYNIVLQCWGSSCGNADTLQFNPCCPSPRLDSIAIVDYSQDILVYGHTETSYTTCKLVIYDVSMNVVQSVPFTCGDFSLLVTGLDKCTKYYAQIESKSTCEGLLSKLVPFTTSGCCDTAKIINVEINPSGQTITVHYSNTQGSNNCQLSMLLGQDLLEQVSLDCNDTTISFYFDKFQYCLEYSLVINTSGEEDCNTVSDTFHFSRCCKRPRITQLNFDENGGTLYYESDSLSDRCRLFVYKYTGSSWELEREEDPVCGDSSISIPLDSCTIYKFVIKAESRICGIFYSQVYFRNGCHGDLNVCEHSYNPIQLSQPVVLPPMLGCNYHKPCITCGFLDSLTIEFMARFTNCSGVPYNETSATPDELQKNALWARFLNYRTGFSLQTGEYYDAYKRCYYDSIHPVPAICHFKPPLNDPWPVYVEDTMPCRDVMTQAEFIAQHIFEGMKDSLLAKFDSIYKAKCLTIKSSEEFYATYAPSEYHYTLYYYDQAGNLVQTLPPAAVKPDYSSSYFSALTSARASGSAYSPTHNYSLATNYRYNTLNQVIAQLTPDGGESHFWYDRLGRLAISQNAKQIQEDKYSYTRYDKLGRITEVGEATNTTTMSQSISRDTVSLKSWLADVSAGTKKQITLTVYDLPYTALQVSYGSFSGLYQQNLRSRVSYSMLFDDESQMNDLLDGTISGGNAATFYSYDIHGNVDTLLQDFRLSMGDIACSNNGSIKDNRFKKIVYNYDLISGKVNLVAYQPEQPDAFYHQYHYDDENRLIEVITSRDSIYWERDAKYDYYRHGPLSRMEMGQNLVQGLDYAYTIQGWLKGVNTTALEFTGNNSHDMGGDGNLANHRTARDAYGFSLNYFGGDYNPIGHTAFTQLALPFPADPVSGIQTGHALYNGNIAAMAVNIPVLGDPQVYGYKYDQLNRIIRMDDMLGLSKTDTTITAARVADYHEEVSYDPNGNIRSYKRNGTSDVHLEMDHLDYHYYTNTNRLKRVNDNPSYTGNYTEDIDDQSDSSNYVYDAIGNLIQDKAEGLDSIKWNVYGKINAIYKHTGAVISYTYDASGNRISKTVSSESGTGYTFYVRDASGNVMSTYEMQDTLKQRQVMLYGSSRLGVLNTDLDVQYCNQPSPDVYTFERGWKQFELSNHLGNVFVTLSDRKHHHSAGDTVQYYSADILSASDYYPFGMTMPERNFSSGNYRYGFNGKENDNEVKTKGNQQDYGIRIYDTRLGKFLSVDPLTKKYPWLTPYQFASNCPIWAIDIDGLEGDKKVDPANQYRHPIQTIEDGYGEYINRTYSVSLVGSKMTAKDIFNDVANNFTLFTTGVSYFEKINGIVGKPAVGDEYSITSGPGFHYTKVENLIQNNGANWYKEFSRRNRHSIDEEGGVAYSGIIKTGVTIKSITEISDKGFSLYSFTFSTWKGHVEAGEITFTVAQFGEGKDAFKTFTISSNSRSAGFWSDKGYKLLGGQEMQTQHWETFLKNLQKYTGAKQTTPLETTQTSETPISNCTPEIIQGKN